jgi:hypothetical protein
MNEIDCLNRRTTYGCEMGGYSGFPGIPYDRIEEDRLRERSAAKARRLERRIAVKKAREEKMAMKKAARLAAANSDQKEKQESEDPASRTARQDEGRDVA